MRHLTREATEIVNQLFDLERGGSGLPWTNKEQITRNLLNQLADVGEVAALPCVVRFLSSSDEETLRCLRRTIATLIARLSLNQLMHFTELFDWASEWYTNNLWGKLTPSRIGAIAGDRHEVGHALVLGLFTFHRSGFVRHEAVRLLSMVTDGTEIPFLLLRQNDWVKPIAKDAQAAVAVRINDDNVEHLAKSLEIVLHLNALSRHDHSDTVSQIIDLLLGEQNDAFLRSAIDSEDRSVRRQVIRLGLKKPGKHLWRLIPYGLKSNDAIVRLNCCHCLTLIHADARLLEALDGMMTDRFMPIRREALRQKSDYFPDAAKAMWQHALLDQHSSIRELACWHVRNTYHDAPSVYYRTVIRESPGSLSALEGLSETGDESDVVLFKQLLNHSLPSRRRIAIQGLMRVGKEASVSIVLPFLRDESPSVVRAVCKCVGSFLSAVSEDDLIAVAMDGKADAGRKAAVNILADLGKWRSLPSLIKIASEAEAETAKYAFLTTCRLQFPENSSQFSPKTSMSALNGSSLTDTLRQKDSGMTKTNMNG
jgi:HEAT repeat protein